MKTIAIMQPTYLPWSGYFGLMQKVDVFVLLDSVQFDKRSWQQRNKIKTANGPIWLTVPVVSKGKSKQLINEVQIDPGSNFVENHIRSIELNYRKTDFYNLISDNLFKTLRDNKTGLLVDLNVSLIKLFKSFLGIETEILLSSQLNGSGSKADMLVSLCEELNAKKYITPQGSRNYIEVTDVFKKSGIFLEYFDYIHPTYNQKFGEFVDNMSIIDILFNCGKDSASKIKKSWENR